jgi:SAM-dependent methyltransferase
VVSSRIQMINKWPKELPALTAEQQRIREEFVALWHEVLPAQYGVVDRFGHRYAVRDPLTLGREVRTLEVGPGLGSHIPFEDLSAQEYHAVELRPELAERLKQRFPAVRVTVADCQRHLPFQDAYFDRILAIHVLEHLPDLPAALREFHRLLRPGGQLCVVIPCEGGVLYSLARNVSARRIFEKRFGQSYDWFVKSEHINVPDEIENELGGLFEVVHRSYFPLLIPVVDLNLCIGMMLRPRGATQ